MKAKLSASTAAVFLAAVFLFSAAAPAKDSDKLSMAHGFFIREGNPAEGRKAFQRLKCYSCHFVEGDALVGTPTSSRRGPVLGKQQSHFSKGFLADSMVSPSHNIAWNSSGRAGEDSELSRMGDFTEIMTVRELFDLIAYIQSAGKKKAKA